MSLFEYATGVKFKKTGREVRTAINQRISELNQRLSKRDRELDEVMNNKALLRSYLVREPRNDYPHSAQLKAEMPTEEEMLPKDKYTIFDRKEKKYRKGIHSAFRSTLEHEMIANLATELPKWTRISQRVNPPGF